MIRSARRRSPMPLPRPSCPSASGSTAMRIARARQQLEAEITRLEGAPNAGIQIGAIRDRISELAVSEASAGSDLSIAERAEPPDAPASPRPVRNGVLAFFAALLPGSLLRSGTRPAHAASLRAARTGPAARPAGADRRPVRSGGAQGAVGSSAAWRSRPTRRCDRRSSSTMLRRRPHVLLMTGARPRRGQDHRHRAARPRPGSGRPPRAARVSRPARAAPARDVRACAGCGLSDILAVLDWDKNSARRASCFPGRRTRWSATDLEQGAARRARRDHERHQGQGSRPAGRRTGDDGLLGPRARAGLRLRARGRAAPAGNRGQPGAGPLRGRHRAGQPPRPSHTRAGGRAARRDRPPARSGRSGSW